MCGHSLGGGCATLLGVLLNDKADPLGYPNPNPNPDPNPDRNHGPNPNQADPLGFGLARKKVDEVYGFGATPVFHNAEPETPNVRSEP